MSSIGARAKRARGVVVASAGVVMAVAGPCRAQPAQCAVRAGADANGTAGAVGYSDAQDTGDLFGVPVASVTTGGAVGGGGGCSAASTAMASARFGSLSASGGGSAVNCPTGSATIYSNATASFRDRIQVGHTSLPPGTRVPVRLRVAYAGWCSSVQAASPYCGGTVDVIASITLGQMRVFTTAVGVFVEESDGVVVGGVIDLQARFARTSGASSGSLQLPGMPAEAVSCGHDALVTVTIEPLIPGVVLTACSGHDYTPPCPSDFNMDGVVDPDDLSDFIACFFGAPPCAGADFNGDGTADPDDLADFIAAYFGQPC